jgi:hypothetical protein
MKSLTLLAALLVLISLLLFTPGVEAQETFDPGVDGYTSIDYDDASGLVMAYSETDITDYDMYGDYEAYVSLTVTNDSGSIIGSSSYRDYNDFGFASVEIDFYGDLATTYTARGFHKLYAMLYDDYWDYDYYPYRHIYDYWDTWYFGYFEGTGVYQPWYYWFFRPYYSPITRRNRYVNLGSTYDSAQVSTPKPGSLTVLSVTVLPTGTSGDYGCTPGQDYGIKVAVKYQVNDTSGQPINKGNMRPQEKVTGTTYNGTSQGDPVPNWSDIGPSRNSQTSRTTNANGQFVDAPYGGCGDSPSTYTFNQSISILVGSKRYTVRANSVTVTSSASGAGSISNGSDIQKSRP